MQALLDKIATDHRAAIDGLFRNCTTELTALATACAQAIASGRKLLFCGNGGSACDAMHIAGEFVGRFIKDRPALAAMALTPDSGILTCIANDYAYEDIFSRQIEALGQKGDVLIAMSTSGKSPNVVKALATAHEKGLVTALFTGEKAKNEPKRADFTVMVPSIITAHVQEAHMVALHGLTGLIELQLFPQL